MKRNGRSEADKKIRKIWKNYLKLSDARFKSGEWVQIEPYQRGWARSFRLRDDAKNRNDAREMQQVLDKINTTVHCKNERFERWNWKTNKMEPIPQKPKYLTIEQYNDLNEKQKSFFVKKDWVETDIIHGVKKKKYISAYVFKYDYYLIFNVEPNIVTHHWIPDQIIESLYGELKTHIQRNNLWIKMAKVLNWGNGRRREWDRKDKPKYRNIVGFEFEEDDSSKDE